MSSRSSPQVDKDRAGLMALHISGLINNARLGLPVPNLAEIEVWALRYLSAVRQEAGQLKRRVTWCDDTDKAPTDGRWIEARFPSIDKRIWQVRWDFGQWRDRQGKTINPVFEWRDLRA